MMKDSSLKDNEKYCAIYKDMEHNIKNCRAPKLKWRTY